MNEMRERLVRWPNGSVRLPAVFAILCAVILLIVIPGWWMRASGQGQVDLTIDSTAGNAPATTIDLSSFSAAQTSLSNGSSFRIAWPGADDISASTIQSASVTATPATKSIVFEGSLDFDGVQQTALVVLDWEGADPTPTISLGVSGTLDMAALDSGWKLEGGTFELDGYLAIATGSQDLAGVSGVQPFYGSRSELPAGIEIEGTVAIDGLLPGFGPDASTELTLAASLESDIAAVLGSEEYSGQDEVTFTGTLAASDLSISGAAGLTSSNFAVDVTLAGTSAADEFETSATGSLTIDDDVVAANPLTFDVTATTDGTNLSLDGGLSQGQTWTDPFGVSGLTVSDTRFSLDAPGGGVTPTFTIRTTTSIATDGAGGDPVSIDASVELNDEIAVDLSLSAITVKQVVGVFGVLGVDTGTGANDLTNIDAELGDLRIEPTQIRLRTESGDLFGAASTGISFRGKTATILLAGGTGPNDGLLVAVTLPELKISNLAPEVPADLGGLSLPSGGFTVSTKNLAKAGFDAGDIEDTYLSNLYCGAAVLPADCDYEVPSGLGLAAQLTLDDGIRRTLDALLPLNNDPVRITGTLPIFGEGDIDLDVALPAIQPDPNSEVGQWLVEARLGIGFTLSGSEIEASLTGEFDTKWEDDTEVGGFDFVTFGVDATLKLGASESSVSIGATVQSWSTPFGIDWVDLNGFRLEITIKFAPTVKVQVGIGVSATLKSACAAFEAPGTACPPPSTFEAAFAIAVSPSPLSVEVGFRIFADAITLRDVAAIAKELGADVDPSDLPDASLRNVEFAFGSIEDEDLCLKAGLTIAADIYVDSPMASAGPGSPVDTGLCSDTSISPAEGIASCAADSSCLAHLRLEVSTSGIQAAASINNISFGPVTVNEASIALALTEDEQYFEIAGDVTVENFATVAGSLRIGPTEFSFSLVTEETGVNGGNKVAIFGRFGLDPDVPGFEVEVEIFVRLPGLDDAFQDVQSVVNEVKLAFTGEPLTTTYSLRCIELKADLVLGGNDPIQGQVTVDVHFSATDTASNYEAGKVWSVGWDFDAPITTNISNLAGSLGGNTSTDEVGCGIDPLITQWQINGVNVISTILTADPDPIVVPFDTPVPIAVGWNTQDFSNYYVELDPGDGSPPVTFGPSSVQPFQNIDLTATADYPRGDAAFERRNISSVVRIGAADGPIIARLDHPVLVGSLDVENYSVTPVASVSPGDILNLNATWTNPVPLFANQSIVSEWSYTVTSLTPGGSNDIQNFPLAATAAEYPVGSGKNHSFAFLIPDPCVCEIELVHTLKLNGTFLRESTRRILDIDFTLPEITAVDVDGTVGATVPASTSGSTLSIDVTDPEPELGAGQYQIWINGLPRTTSGAYPTLSTSLDPFAVDSQRPVPLHIEVRSTSDLSTYRSETALQSVIFRPLNSASATPSFFGIASLPGSTEPQTLESTTRFPVTSDDGSLNPFGSVDCGAIWFSYSAAADQTLELSTIGSRTSTPRPGGDDRQELAIAVYERPAGGSSTLLTQILPDGNPNVTVYPQELTIDVQSDADYFIAVAASDMPANCADTPTVSGPVVLRAQSIGVPPIADSFWTLSQAVNAAPRYALLETVDPVLNDDQSSNIGAATVDLSPVSGFFDQPALDTPGFDQCFSTGLDQTLWYLEAFTNPTQVPLTFMVAADREIPLEIAVFKRVGLTDLVLAGCAEGIGADGFASAPQVTFDPGLDFDGSESYAFLIDTKGAAEGFVTPVVFGAGSFPNDAMPIQLDAAPTSVSNFRSFAAVEDVECSAKELAYNRWFEWTAPSSEPVDIGVPLAGADAVLAVFEGMPRDDAFEEIGCEDVPGTSPETLRLDPVAGQTYYVLLASELDDFGTSNENATFEIQITSRADQSVNEITVPPSQFPIRAELTNVNATSESRPGSCASDIASVHHRYTSLTDPNLPVAPTFDLDIDTFGSDFDTTLIVSNFAQEVGCNDDAGVGLQSRLRLDDIQGTLFMQIDGYNGATGNIKLNVTTRGDDVRNAVPLVGATASGTLDTTYASVEPDERRGSCHFLGDTSNATVWWSWTAPEDGVYDISATGFDTQLTIFDANGDGSAGEIVGCGEDEVGLTALDELVATAGTTYLFQVDGYLANTGSATLSITQTSKEVGIVTLPDPCVVFDTTVEGASFSPGESRTVQVVGALSGQGGESNCGVPVNAEAVVLTLTARAPQAVGNLRASAAGVAPSGGVVNYTANGLDNSNTITVDLSLDGAIDLAANAGATDVRAAVVAFYAPVEDPVGFFPLNPCAVSDSRAGQGPTGSFVGPFTAASSIPDIDVVGTFSAAQGGGNSDCGVPAGADAVVVNVVSVQGTGGSGGFAVGTGGTTPTDTSTNFAPIGLNNAASTIVPLDGGETIAAKLISAVGSPSSHLRVVVLGYIGTGGAEYRSTVPCAIFDTRSGQGATGAFLGKRVGGAATTYDVVGTPTGDQGGVAGGCGVPASAEAVLINLVAIQPEAVGNLRAYATGSTPTGGVLNFNSLTPPANNSNAVVVPVSALGQIDVFVNSPPTIGVDATHVRGVILGYFS